MLAEARAHQVSRARMATLYGGALLALAGFVLDNLAGQAPDGAFLVAGGVVLALAASLRAGRSLASRFVAALLGLAALAGLALVGAAALSFALSDFTLVIQGETSPVQVSAGIGAIPILAALGLGLLIFGIGLAFGRILGSLRPAIGRLFDLLDGLVSGRAQTIAAVQFVGLAQVPKASEESSNDGR